MPTPATDIDLALAAELGQQLRVDSVRSSTSAGSGHPTSSMSAADLISAVGSPALRATFDPANFVQCGVRPFTDGYRQLRSFLVYLQVKDALAATGEVVPAGEGDGEVRETLAALRDSGFEGFMSLEPHLARAGRFGGFSGPQAFTRAVRALKSLLNELGIPWQ